jgi:hypothetical protein
MAGVALETPCREAVQSGIDDLVRREGSHLIECEGKEIYLVIELSNIIIDTHRQRFCKLLALIHVQESSLNDHTRRCFSSSNDSLISLSFSGSISLLLSRCHVSI